MACGCEGTAGWWVAVTASEPAEAREQQRDAPLPSQMGPWTAGNTMSSAISPEIFRGQSTQSAPGTRS